MCCMYRGCWVVGMGIVYIPVARVCAWFTFLRIILPIYHIPSCVCVSVQCAMCVCVDGCL